MQPKLLMFQQFHVPPISACCIEPTGIRVPTARRVRAEPRQPVFTINPERHFISHNSSRLAVSRAVRVFREKPSEKFSRAVPKFALVSVTSITPRLSPSPSFLVRIVRTDLRSAPQEPSTEEKPLIPPIPPPLLAPIPSIARHVTPPNNPVLRQYRGFLQHLPLPPSRFRPPTSTAKPLSVFRPGRRVAPSSFAPSSVSETPSASQCCQIRESFSTVISRNTLRDSHATKSAHKITFLRWTRRPAALFYKGVG